MSEVKQYPCACGRSPTGYCVGLHAMSNEQYRSHLEQLIKDLEKQQKSLNEQTKPQFLRD